jgi:hypothetical protein
VPHYYLNLFNGDGAAPDDEGQDFADLGAARAEAIRGIRSLLADEMGRGVIVLAGRIEIADRNGAVLQTIDFADAVEIRN